MTEGMKEQWEQFQEEYKSRINESIVTKSGQQTLGSSKVVPVNASTKKDTEKHNKLYSQYWMSAESLEKTIDQVIATTNKKVEDAYNQILNTHEEGGTAKQVFNQKRFFELLTSLDYITNNQDSFDFVSKSISPVLNTEDPEMGYLLTDIKNFVLALELYQYYQLIDTTVEGGTLMNSLSRGQEALNASVESNNALNSSTKKKTSEEEKQRLAEQKRELLKKKFDELNIDHYLNKIPVLLQEMSAHRLSNTKKQGNKLSANDYTQLQQVIRFKPQINNTKKYANCYNDYAITQIKQYIKFCLSIESVIVDAENELTKFREQSANPSLSETLESTQTLESKSPQNKKSDQQIKQQTTESPQTSQRTSKSQNSSRPNIVKNYITQLQNDLNEIYGMQKRDDNTKDSEKQAPNNDQSLNDKITAQKPNIIFKQDKDTKLKFRTLIQYIQWFIKIYNIDPAKIQCDPIEKKPNILIAYEDLLQKYNVQYDETVELSQKDFKKQDSQECRIDLDKMRLYRNNLQRQIDEISRLIEQCKLKSTAQHWSDKKKEMFSQAITNVQKKNDGVKNHAEYIIKDQMDKRNKLTSAKPKYSFQEMLERQREHTEAFVDRITNARIDANAIRDYLENRGTTLLKTQEIEKKDTQKYTQQEIEEYEQKFNEWYQSALSSTKKNRKPILVLDISINKARKAKVKVYQGDEPQRIALQFCVTHQLSVEKYLSLVQVLEQEFKKRKIPYTEQRPIPVETVVKILRSKLGFSKTVIKPDQPNNDLVSSGSKSTGNSENNGVELVTIENAENSFEGKESGSDFREPSDEKRDFGVEELNT